LAYEARGKTERALATYQRALEVNPASRRALEHLGRLQLQEKQYEEARRTFQRLLALHPESVEARYQIMWLEKLKVEPSGEQ
jgi:Flp pilus assembly protein TadD